MEAFFLAKPSNHSKLFIRKSPEDIDVSEPGSLNHISPLNQASNLKGYVPAADGEVIVCFFLPV